MEMHFRQFHVYLYVEINETDMTFGSVCESISLIIKEDFATLVIAHQIY